MELFSSSRLTKLAESQGFHVTTPAAFDLQEGWDVFNSEDRKSFWRTLEKEEPDFITLSPKCRAFSVLMNANVEKMSKEKLRNQSLGHATFRHSGGGTSVEERKVVSAGATGWGLKLADSCNGLVESASFFHGHVHGRPTSTSIRGAFSET